MAVSITFFKYWRREMSKGCRIWETLCFNANGTVLLIFHIVFTDIFSNEIARINLCAGLIGITNHFNAALFTVKPCKFTKTAAVKHKIMVDTAACLNKPIINSIDNRTQSLSVSEIKQCISYR